MAKEKRIEVTPAEFEQIPLDFIIAQPLITTINAHQLAATTTLQFIKGLLKESAEFKVEYVDQSANGQTKTNTRTIKVPLLAITPIPSLRFDSLDIHFEYNISQIYKESSETKAQASGEVSLPKILKGLLNINLQGSIARRSESEFTSNRSGSMQVKVHVSEAPIPKGLDMIITAMTNTIGSKLGIPEPNTESIPDNLTT